MNKYFLLIAIINFSSLCIGQNITLQNLQKSDWYSELTFTEFNMGSLKEIDLTKMKNAVIHEGSFGSIWSFDSGDIIIKVIEKGVETSQIKGNYFYDERRNTLSITHHTQDSGFWEYKTEISSEGNDISLTKNNP